MVIFFKITLSTLISFIPLYVLAHKVTLEDKSLEKIVNERMAIMQKIKSTSSKLYRLINSDQYEEMLELNKTLLHSASEFKDFYPENSQADGASDNIWSDRETFNEYNQNFLDDIEMISLSIELEDKEMLGDDIKAMAENGNPNSITDAGVGALCARTAVIGAYLNVKINCKDLDDKEFVNKTLKEAEDIVQKAKRMEKEILDMTILKL